MSDHAMCSECGQKKPTFLRDRFGIPIKCHNVHLWLSPKCTVHRDETKLSIEFEPKLAILDRIDINTIDGSFIIFGRGYSYNGSFELCGSIDYRVKCLISLNVPLEKIQIGEMTP